VPSVLQGDLMISSRCLITMVLHHCHIHSDSLSLWCTWFCFLAGVRNCLKPLNPRIFLSQKKNTSTFLY